MPDASAAKAATPSKRTSPPETPAAPEVPDAPVADETPVGTTDEPAPEPAAPAAEPGWFRNTAATELTVLPHLYPSARLAPGEATWLPDDPRHPNLERCDAPATDAPADTAGSEK